MRKRSVSGGLVIGIVLTMATAVAVRSQRSGDQQMSAAESPVEFSADATGESAVRSPHAVVIHALEAPAGVDTGQRDHHGQPIRLTCRNCHDVQPVNTQTSAARDLDRFHQGLVFNHGQLACVSCHNSQDGYTTLHLADGSAVDYAATMRLCAQCHGTQHRNYQRGAHGGMTGYWDLSQGPRQRNHCVDCHDPHAPQFPSMQPAAGPNDRFLPTHKDSVH